MNGPIYGNYDEHKSCNYCKNFCGYGAHCFAGKCKVKGIEIGFMEYNKIAKECGDFDCKENLIAYYYDKSCGKSHGLQPWEDVNCDHNESANFVRFF